MAPLKEVTAVPQAVGGLSSACSRQRPVNHEPLRLMRHVRHLGLGFELCGMDLTLYRGTEEASEVAVFLAREL